MNPHILDEPHLKRVMQERDETEEQVLQIEDQLRNLSEEWWRKLPRSHPLRIAYDATNNRLDELNYKLEMHKGYYEGEL